jgi:hypothetical protein
MSAAGRTQPDAPSAIQLIAGAAVSLCIVSAFGCLVLDAFARRSVGRIVLYGSLTAAFLFTIVYVIALSIGR